MKVFKQKRKKQKNKNKKQNKIKQVPISVFLGLTGAYICPGKGGASIYREVTPAAPDVHS